MKGIDVSHWNGNINWNKVQTDFAIIKCSQGVNSKDPMFETNKKGARDNNILAGYYHFAATNNPVGEADWFVKTVGDIQPGELLALDAETGQSPQWCRMFLDEVTKQVGFKPLAYVPAGNGWNWQTLVDGNYGLWIARYTSSKIFIPWWLSFPPRIGQWPFYAIWQYSSKGRENGINGFVDENYTKMSLNTLKKYGKL